MPMSRKIWTGLAWIAGSNVADLALTLWGLRLQVITEANPAMAALLARDPGIAAALKLAAVLFCIGALVRAYPRRPHLVSASTIMLSAAMLGVMGLHARWVLVYLLSGAAGVAGGA